MRNYYVVILLFLLCSCDKYDVTGIFKAQSPSVEVRFKNSMDYNSNNSIPDIYVTCNDYSFFVSTDFHAITAEKWVKPFVSQVLADTVTESFGICLGDLTNAKDLHHVVWDALKPLRDAGYNLFITLGNHDLYFGDWYDYEGLWHTSAYSFKVVTPSAGTDFFLTFDSAEGTLGHSQLEWLREQLNNAKQQNYRHIVLFTHTHFFKRDCSQEHTSNYNSEETIELLAMFAEYGVDCVLTGHDHFYEHTIYRGVEYFTLNSMAEYDDDRASYYRVNISDDIDLDEIML